MMSKIGNVSRIIFLGFFVSHIAATVLMDGQAIFGAFYPSSMVDFVQWYAVTFKDPHFSGDSFELWFQTCVALEFLVQLPYFFIASRYFWKKRQEPCPSWFRVYSLVYAAQAVTAFLPVIVIVLYNEDATPTERMILAQIYAPYLLVPIWLAYVMLEPPMGAAKTTIAPMSGGMKTAMTIFFGSHVPITIFIDSQAVFTTLHPQLFKDIVSWYIRMLGDPLMTAPFELWFQCLVACESSIQFAFFLVVLQQLRSDKEYPWWFGPASLLYGAHVSTTLIPIYAVLWTNEVQSITQKIITTLVYAPYLIFPAWLAHWAAGVCLRDNSSGKKK